MYLPRSYQEHPLWLTIDVEEIEDANFGITPKHSLKIDYESIIDRWIDLCAAHEIRSCAFVLGTFAKKYPGAVRRLHEAGHDIASHGLRHQLVYELPFKRWQLELEESKQILQEIIGEPIYGYRSPSWTLPFERRYYEALAELGFSFSSSYFPFKTYMYGHTIDKKRPFTIFTPSGKITEIPVPKRIIPFSGGFYMRLLPTPILIALSRGLIKDGIKPIIYTHPYELQDRLFFRYITDMKVDMAYCLTFANTGSTPKRIEAIIKSIKKDHNA